MNDVSGLTALLASVSRRMIVPLNAEARQPDSTAPIFFCIHSLSGSVGNDFADLAQEIGSGVRFFAIQAPKKLMQQCENLREEGDGAAMLQFVVNSYAEAITALHPEGEINLGGWSAGALVALETAQLLRARGRRIGVFVSFDGAPRHVRTSAGSGLRYAARVLWNLPAALFYDDFGRIRRRISQSLGQLLRRKSARAPLAESHPVESFMQNWCSYPPYQQTFMRNMYNALEETDYCRYDGAVIVYKATVQPIPLSGVAEFWKRVAPDCTIVNMRGTHNKLVFKPFVTPLALDLNRRLNEPR